MIDSKTLQMIIDSDEIVFKTQYGKRWHICRKCDAFGPISWCGIDYDWRWTESKKVGQVAEEEICKICKQVIRGEMNEPLPKSIDLMVEFNTTYWTCPQCGIDFAVLLLHGIDKGEVPVSFTTAIIVDFCPLCGRKLKEKKGG